MAFAAWTLAINWLLFSSFWIYAPLSPAFLVYGAGEQLGIEIAVRHEDMWALADLMSLVAVSIRCRNAWWSPLLWVPYLITLTMHTIAWCNGLEYIDYRAVLDASLVIQLAVIFTLGGGGCADRMSDLWGGFRSVVQSAVRLLGVVA